MGEPASAMGAAASAIGAPASAIGAVPVSTPVSSGVGGVSIEALELFVEVLSQSEQAPSTGDGFYDQLCEAVCRLARMRRAIIFRYDSARRRVRAAGAHGLDLEQFAGAHVTVESAPIAARSLREDSVVEVVGDITGQVPDEYMAYFPEPVRLLCAPMAASGRAMGVILADRLMSAPPLDDAERHLLWTLGKRPHSPRPRGSWPPKPRRRTSSSSGSTSRATCTRA
jgi:hypothetical protein